MEGSKGEAGYGQHELNVEYCDALGNADQHVVFKQCLKEVAIQEGKFWLAINTSHVWDMGYG